MVRAAVAVLLGLTACSGSTTVTVELAYDLPDFIAYRDGTSAWRTPKPASGGTYAAHHFELEVTADYEVVAVSRSADSGTVSMELHATSEDSTHWILDGGGAHDLDRDVIEPYQPATLGLCSSPDMPWNVPGTIVASGTMAQAGRIAMAGMCTESSKDAWTYQLSVSAGVHDLIATGSSGSTSPRVEIVRGVPVDEGTILPAIDLATDGQLLDLATITVVNTGTEPDDATSITNELVLYTANSGGATLTSGLDNGTSRSHAVPVVPASLLEASDRQVLSIVVTDYSGAQRAASTRSPARTPVIELLSAPVIDYTTDTGVDTATWSEPLSARVAAVDVHTWSMDASSNLTSQTITATTRWLDSNHSTSLAFDRDVPNYDPSWAVDVAQRHSTELAVRSTEGDIEYVTARSQTK